MTQQFDYIQLKAMYMNHAASSSSGVTYLYNDRYDNHKFKIGRSNRLGSNVALSIDTDGLVSGSFIGTFSGTDAGEVWTRSGNDIYYNTGEVGIGTTTPKVPLDIFEMGGLILGYTALDNADAASYAQYTCTTGTPFVVPTSDWQITFVAPANGKVEIQFNGYMASGGSGSQFLYLGLSTSDTYATLGSKYENECAEPDEDDNSYIQMLWPITGLTPGTTYTYYVGTRASAGTHNWMWGGTDSLMKPKLIIRAISLPNNIHTD